MAYKRCPDNTGTRTKKCAQCGVVFAQRFYDGKKAWDARKYCSKRCGVLGTRAARRESRRDGSVNLVVNGNKRCSSCRQSLPIDQFWRSHDQGDISGYCRMCKSCRNHARDMVRGQVNARRKIACRTSVERYIRYLFHASSRRAKQRKLCYEVTLEFLLERYHLQDGRCYYSGEPMTFLKTKETTNISIERKDSSIGYTPENVVLCCYFVNMSKGHWPVQEWIYWADKVRNHLAGNRQECV